MARLVKVLLRNGTSSAGEPTIAQALLEVLETLFLAERRRERPGEARTRRAFNAPPSP
jgi:hypothetical protein